MEKLKEVHDLLSNTTKRLGSLLSEEKSKVVILEADEVRMLHEALNHYQMRNQNIVKSCSTNGSAFQEAVDHVERAKKLRTILKEA
jgi:hypothetical protein